MQTSPLVSPSENRTMAQLIGTAMRSPVERHAARQQDQLLFRVSYAGGYLFFLASAAACRVLPRDVNPFTRGQTERSSIFDDARRATTATIPYAFMG